MIELPAGSFEPGSKLPAGLADAVAAWSAQDPDPDTRGELASLLDQIDGRLGRVPRPSSPTPSAAASSSAPPACAERSGPARTG